MTTFKNVFEEKINQYQIKQDVLKRDKTNKRRVTTTLGFACLLVLAIPFISPKENSTILDAPYDIHINQLDAMGLAKLDVDAQSLEVNELNHQYPFLNHLSIDEAYTLDVYALYGRKNPHSDVYDMLDSYVLSYTNDDKRIRIAFSETNEPVRDYFISHENAKITTMNDVALTLYQWEHMLMATFNYQGIYFDIETSNVEINDLVDIIKQITN